MSAAAAEPNRAGDAWLPLLLHELALAGYGIWMLLGAALTLGLYRSGRSEVLVPLTLGGCFVGAGLLAALLRLPRVHEWRGWQPARDSRPGREALFALSAYLPMLALAGLARGDNGFWATRAAGAALALCSLANLAYAVGWPRGGAGPQPFGSVVSAAYGGGLWLWLCLAAQDDAVHPAGTHPWIMVLILLALLLGFTEGLRWQVLRAAPRGGELRPARFFAAVFTYALPCVVLLLDDRFDSHPAALAGAALSCLAGLTIERRLYVQALARRTAEGGGVHCKFKTPR
ncbi:hypothetical protein [Fulvimonas soli]|nr:hypothetical protein [Fulvimonas soli]